MTISARFLSSEDKLSPPTRTSVVTALATLLGLHSAIKIYDPSIMTVILGVCAAIFLSKGFQLCQTESSVQLPSKESFDIEILELTPSPFLVRLRSIAFLLTIMSAVGFIVLCRLCSFDQAISGKWWQTVFTLGGIEAGCWMLICFLVTNSVEISNHSFFNKITTHRSLQVSFALLQCCNSFILRRAPSLPSKPSAHSSYFAPIQFPRPICRPDYR